MHYRLESPESTMIDRVIQLPMPRDATVEGRYLLLPRLLHLLQVGPELFHLGFADLDTGHFMEAARRKPGLIAVGQAGEDAHRFVAVIGGLLAHGAVDLSVDDALENRVYLVEADDFDFVRLARFLRGLQTDRRVIGEEADPAGEVRRAGPFASLRLCVFT